MLAIAALLGRREFMDSWIDEQPRPGEIGYVDPAKTGINLMPESVVEYIASLPPEQLERIRTKNG
jgi:hypothetical protein